MISWDRIGRAVEFYKALGYKYVEAPWVVDEDCARVTHPNGELSRSTHPPGVLVGSAEQALLSLREDLSLPAGRIVACTPCFRAGEEGAYNLPYFMKVELWYWGPAGPKDAELLRDARSFLEAEGASPREVKTPEGVDLYVGELEVGSYGVRNNKTHAWSYGTGVAEPRLSQAIALQKKETQ